MQMGIFKGKRNEKDRKRENKNERKMEGSIDGGGQGDKVSCRVFALEEAGFQRGNERQRRERTRL